MGYTLGPGLGPKRCGVALELRTLRTNRHRVKVDLNSGVGEMCDLDDLEIDPLEMTILFDGPTHRGTAGRLTAMIPNRAQVAWNAEREVHEF